MNPFPTTNQVPDNIRYLAARPFKLPEGDMWPGDEIDASTVPDIQLLVQAGFVVPFAPNQGYSHLPPHLWTYVQRKTDADAKLAGDPSARRGAVVPQEQTDNPVIQESELHAQNQDKLHSLVLRKSRAQSTPANRTAKKSTGSVEDTKNASSAKAAKKADAQTELKVSQGERRADTKLEQDSVAEGEAAAAAEDIKQGKDVQSVEAAPADAEQDAKPAKTKKETGNDK